MRRMSFGWGVEGGRRGKGAAGEDGELREGGLCLSPNMHRHPNRVPSRLYWGDDGVRINTGRGSTRSTARGHRQPHSVATMFGTWCALMRSSDRLMRSLPV